MNKFLFGVVPRANYIPMPDFTDKVYYKVYKVSNNKFLTVNDKKVFRWVNMDYFELYESTDK